MERRFCTQALSVVLSLFVSTCFSQSPAALSRRINACFSASKHEVAENLCLYYNNRFDWASSYGAVDRFARGTYTISNDTVYLDSHRPPSFTIRSALVKTIPPGKIQLVFKSAGRHASYINAAIGNTSLSGVDRLKKSGQDFVTMIPAPTERNIHLGHSLFDEQGADYPLPANGNQYTITVSDSIGQTAFEHLPLVWGGVDLKPATETSSGTFRFTAQYPSYDEIPWKGTEQPSKEAFDKWAGAQKAAFDELAQKQAEAMHAAALAAAEKMKHYFAENWNAAFAIARENGSGIIVLLGEDSVLSNDAVKEDTTVTVNRKELLAEVYYRFFAADDKLPAFLKLPSKEAGKQYKVSVLPAQLMLDPQGRLLYKNEGSVMEAAALHSVWEQIKTQEEERRTDSLIRQFSRAGSDSAGLLQQIETITLAGPSLKKALEEAGVNSRSLVDNVVQRYYSRQAFTVNNYDFVSAAYFPEDSWRYYSGVNKQSVSTPAVRYLVDHFGERQKAMAGNSKIMNDSLLARAYFGLISLLGYARVGSNDPDTAVAYLKKMVTGVARDMDFFTSISCIQGELELAGYKALPLAKRKELIPGFMREYFGDPLPPKVSVDAASAAIYKSMRAANNQVMIRNYLGADSTEKRFVQIGNSVAGYFLTIQAKLLLDASPDASISLSMLQQSGALPLLETAGSYNAVAESYLLRRNYAYALYLSGKIQPAIALLQQVITDMKQPANKYLATGERIKLANENLRAMKEGRTIGWTVAALTDY